jgi:hypothetical protein
MKNNFTFYTSIGLLIFSLACIESDDEIPFYENLISLNLPYDTLQVESGRARLTLNVFGEQFFEEEIDLVNKGLFTTVKDKRLIQDTLAVEVNGKSLDWITSNAEVASVSNGQLTFGKDGQCEIYAKANNVTSNKIIVIVNPATVVYTIPALNLTPPLRVLTFTNVGIIDGKVEVGSNLFVDRKKTAYDQSGKFNSFVYGLQLGEQTVPVKAINALSETHFNEQSKIFIYQNPSPTNSIIGSWVGIAAGYNFYFDVSYNASKNNFDVSGRLLFKIASEGIDQEITFKGIIDETGRLNIVIEETYNQLTIKAGITGFFSDNDTASGSIFIKSQVLLFSKTESGNWTASKLN